MSNQIHIQWPDIAKGIGIILVIFGHGMFPFHSLIDSFHMPLFYVLAGLFVDTEKYKIGEYVAKRFERVMIPFCIYALVVGLYAFPMGWNEVVHHVCSLWFLYTIFIASSLYYVIRRCMTLKWCNILLILMVTILTIFHDSAGDFGHLWVAIERILYAVVFIHVGYLYKRYSDTINLNWLVVIAAIFVFLLCNILILEHFAPLNISYYSGTLFKLPMYLLWPVSLSGCYIVIIISKKIGTANILQYFGRNSLAIYALHIPLIWKINNFISRLPHYEQMICKLLYGALEYCAVFTFIIFLIWALQKVLPTRYYKFLGISK